MTETQPNPARPLALVLKGGGVKGLALAGALEELEKHYRFEVFVGTSAGGIAAVLLAAGYSATELRQILWDKDFREFLDSSPFSLLWNLLHGGLHSGKPVREWVRQLLIERIGLKNGVEMADLKKRAVLYASNERDGTVTFDSAGDNDTAPADFAVRCSMSIPYFFQPERHEGADIFDGGLGNNFPLQTFRDNNPDLDFLGLYLSSGPPPSSRLLRLLSILLEGGERALVDDHKDQIIVIDPSPIRTTQFGLGELEKRFLLEAGRAAALEYLASAKPDVVRKEQAREAKAEANGLRTRVQQTLRRQRRHRALLCLVLVAVIVVASFFRFRPETTPPTPATPAAQPIGPAPLSPPAPAAAPAVDFASMPEEELRSWIGQLFLVGFVEQSPGETEVVQRLIERWGIGGVLLYDRNVPPGGSDSQRQRRLIEMIDSIQQQGARRSGGLPMIVAVDQEGGLVQALGPEIVTEMPAAMALGGLRSPAAAEQAGFLIGSELRALGVNVNLAPVADVNTNSNNDLIRDRSFGGGVELVTRMAAAWLTGAERAGIVSVVKHFPGHGKTEEGFELPQPRVPVSQFTSDQFKEALLPFQDLVDQGAAAVMTSHFNPTSISGETVTFDPDMIDLLRQSGSIVLKGASYEALGFEGVVLTDDLDVPSMTTRAGSTREEVLRSAIQRAFMAGHDILLLGHVFPNQSGGPQGYLSRSPKGITLDEFGRLLEDFERFVFDDGSPRKRAERIRRVRESLLRLAAFKAKLAPERAGVERRHQLLESLRPKHAQTADCLFRASLASIVPTTGFPSLRLAPQDKLLVVFGSSLSRSKLARLQPEEYKDRLKLEIDDRHVVREIADEFRDRVHFVWNMEAIMPQPDDYQARAMEIARLIQNEKPQRMLFVLGNTYQAEQFAHILWEMDQRKVSLKDVVVVVPGQPNLLEPFAQSSRVRNLWAQISYVFAYTSERRRGAEVLAEELSRLAANQAPGKAGPPPMLIPRLNDNVSLFTLRDTKHCP